MRHGEFISDAPRQRDLDWWLGFTAVLIIITVTLHALPGRLAGAVALLCLGLSLQLRRGSLLRVIPLTLGLATMIFVTHAAIEAICGPEGVEPLREAGALVLSKVLMGELWRVPIYVFLHRNWDHVTANALYLLGFGMALEPVLGSRRLAQGMLVAFAAASATGLAFAAGSGFSGITYGMHGILLARPYRVGTGPRRSLDWAWIMAVWLLVRYFVPSQFSDWSGFEAHAGGLIGGLWFGIACAGTPQATHSRRRLILRVATSSAVTVALVAALATNPRWIVMWHARAADQADSIGDVKSALRHWAAVESLAKAGAPSGDMFFVACEYRLSHGAARAATGRNSPSHGGVASTDARP
jgi:membrane associated rhomboid family serine protease